LTSLDDKSSAQGVRDAIDGGKTHVFGVILQA
jgi:hypothetical protein